VKDDDYSLSSDDEDEDLSNYLEHKWSFIEMVHVDRTVKDGITKGYSVHASSRGRWSQHGFAVKQALFSSSTHWGTRPEPPFVPFPFQVTYDLNILPPVALPLTADRNGIILSEESLRICSLLAEKLSMAFFRSLGTAAVRGQRTFFESMAALGKDEGTPFLRALNEFLGV
jgi:hypothetical protein